MPDDLLSAEEIERLTGKKRRPAQVRVLRQMGVRHIVRPDGCVLVARAARDKLLGVSARVADAAPEEAPRILYNIPPIRTRRKKST